jgi:hypothetical protein
MVMSVRTLLVGSLLCLSLPAVAQEATPDDVLALCHSTDPLAKRFCLKKIEAAGDQRPEVRAVVRELARDPAVASDAAGVLERVYQESAPPAPEAVEPPPAPESQIGEGDPTRVIYSSSAFPRRRGETAMNAFMLGTYHFDHGITDNITIGAQTAIPIGFAAGGATVKLSLPFEGGAVALWGNGILIKPFSDDSAIGIIGGGPIVSLGNRRTFFNAGLYFYHLSGLDDDGGVSLAIPHLGVSHRVSDRVRLGAELYVPMLVSETTELDMAALVLGVRIFGKSIWGDIALIEPICDGCGEVYSTIPLGIPFVNLGANL